MNAHSEDISLFRDKSPILRRIHSRLVPSAFPDRVFWSRLFFKLEQRDEARRKSQELLDHVTPVGDKAAADDADDRSDGGGLAELEKLTEDGSDGLPNDWE
jgi:hypothetical protein